MEFILPDMHCGHCVQAVTRALRASDPDCTVEVDLPGRRVRVESRNERESLRQALTAAGYPPA